MALLGNPATVTLTSQGLDLLVLPGGPRKVRIYGPTGAGTIRVDRIQQRAGWKGGTYRVAPRRHLHLRGLVFQGALHAEQTWTT
jgi:hypothetical protein